MYLERIFPIMRQMREDRPSGAFAVLDLCAAPGGKTTHLLSMLRDIPTSFLVSNEVIRSRASVLCENVSKWGPPMSLSPTMIRWILQIFRDVSM